MRYDILRKTKDRYIYIDRDNCILGVGKIFQRQRCWGHHSCGKGCSGDSRVYQKISLPYLDSSNDKKEKYQEGGGKGGGYEE